jgi:hypothetical protein
MTTHSLDTAEAARREIQAALDHRKQVVERNRLGQFSTPPDLAVEMAVLGRQYLPGRGAVRFLDPAVGSGVFFYAAKKVLGPRVRWALGFEIDHEVVAAVETLWAPLGLSVRDEDFCTTKPPMENLDKATLILCNPPYVRHHHLTAKQKERLWLEARRLGLRVSGLAGLYCYFMVLSHRWLADGGVGVWIVPAEFLDVNYGRAIKEYLLTRVTPLRIHRFDPEDAQFTDALVSSVVVVFRNAPPPEGHLVQFTSGGRLSAPGITHPQALDDLSPEAKWGLVFCQQPQMRSADGRALTVGDVFSVKRGLATGANEYFILGRQQAAELGLPDQFLRPILPSPRHVPGPVIEAAEDGFPRGLRELVLLDCDLPRDQIREQYPALEKYLERGEKQGVAQRYLPQHRSLWYRQESRPPAQILCTYMGRQKGGRAIRFLRNRSAATAPNVYLLLYPRPELEPALRAQPDLIDRLFEALQESAFRLAPGGRVYGGGLNKIEPRELQAIELPEWVKEMEALLGISTGKPGATDQAAARTNGRPRRVPRGRPKARRDDGLSLFDYVDSTAAAGTNPGAGDR